MTRLREYRRVVAIAAVIAVSVSSSMAGTGETVRGELARMQKQTGLALATYWVGLQVVSFRKHRKYDGNKLVPMDGGAGAVSPSGTEIAVRVDHFEKDYRDNRELLGVVRSDGSGLREYPEVHPIDMMDGCWSHDQSKMAMTVRIGPYAKLGILDLGSSQMRTFESQGPLNDTPHFTSQCWSPDDRQVVFGNDGSVQLTEIGKDELRILARGTKPTWSPDGNWIAFHDGNSFYAIRPSGTGKRKLFHKTRAVSALFWSPDSRFVAYVHADFFALDVEFYHLMVRRLEDGAEDWVADGVECCISYQWVTNPALLKQAKDAGKN